MENIIEYIENNMKPFGSKAFNAVDSLILSELSYIRYENISFVSDRKAPVKIGELLKAEFSPQCFKTYVMLT
jgi:hypothetical protein